MSTLLYQSICTVVTIFVVYTPCVLLTYAVRAIHRKAVRA